MNLFLLLLVFLKCFSYECSSSSILCVGENEEYTTISAALLASKTPGDKILIKGGTYSESLDISSSNGNGDVDSFIELMPFETDTVIIESKSKVISSDASFWKIHNGDGTLIINLLDADSLENYGFGVDISKTSNFYLGPFTISNEKFYDYADGVVISGVNFNVTSTVPSEMKSVEENYFNQIAWDIYYSVFISLEDVSDIIFQNNVFKYENELKEMFYAYAGSRVGGGIENLVVQNNLFLCPKSSYGYHNNYLFIFWNINSNSFGFRDVYIQNNYFAGTCGTKGHSIVVESSSDAVNYVTCAENSCYFRYNKYEIDHTNSNLITYTNYPYILEQNENVVMNYLETGDIPYPYYCPVNQIEGNKYSNSPLYDYNHDLRDSTNLYVGSMNPACSDHTDCTADSLAKCGSSNNCEACDHNDQCTGSKSYCVSGVCVQCSGHSSCTADSLAKCGDSNSCVSCDDDSQCTESNSFCVSGTCKECNSHSTCTADSLAKCGSSYACEICDDNSQCTGSNEFCVSGNCKECNDHSSCTTDSFAKCGDSYTCEICDDNSQCTGSNEYCVAGACKECNGHSTCTADALAKCGDSYTCETCDADEQCTGSNAYCVAGDCKECDGHSTCTDDSLAKCGASYDCEVCDDDSQCTGSNSYCVSGSCKECNGHSTCTSDGLAKCGDSNACEICDDNSQCTGSNEYCIAGACKECNGHLACTDDSLAKCGDSYTCEICDNDSQCTGSNTYCVSGTCKECDGHSTCSDDSLAKCGASYTCETCDADEQCTGSNTYCVSGNCEQCDGHSTCTDDSLAKCGASYVCETCDDDSQCTGSNSYCISGSCKECSGHSTCTSDGLAKCGDSYACEICDDNSQCTGSNEYCVAGACKECNDHSTCTADSLAKCGDSYTCETCDADEQCTGSNAYCVAGDCKECDGHSTCTDDSLAKCGSSYTCEICDNDDQCTGSNSYCVSGTCEECNDHSHCTNDLLPKCGITKTCISCDYDSECTGSKVLCISGVCGDCVTDNDCATDSDAKCLNNICVSCDADEQCTGSNGYCVSGSCEECNDHSHCPENIASKCGLSNTCVSCDSNDQCTGSNQYCVSGTCRECNSHSSCTADSFSKCGDSYTCEICDDDSQCTGSNSYCISGSCKECNGHSTCTSDGLAKCGDSYTCEICDDNSQCTGSNEYCIAGACKECNGHLVCTDDSFAKCGDSYTCETCDDHSQCTGSNTYCVVGACEQCDEHSNCADDSLAKCGASYTCEVCDDDSQCTGSNEYCVSGTCQECNDHSSCTADSFSKCGDSYTCEICDDDSQCTGSNSYCISGSCKECNSHSTCTDDSLARCGSLYNCEVCDDDVQCTGSNEYCVSGVCKQCNDNSDCIGSKKFCDNYNCEECISHNDCGNDDLGKCENNACVACDNDEQCHGGFMNKVCILGKCEECRDHSDCVNDILARCGYLNKCYSCSDNDHCTGQNKICDSLTRVCVPCNDDSQCTGTKNLCISGECGECRDNSDCTGSNKFCVNSNCEECSSHNDCKSIDKAMCDDDYTCKPCYSNWHCLEEGLTFCDLTNGMCEECYIDSTCEDISKPTCKKIDGIKRCVPCESNEACIYQRKGKYECLNGECIGCSSSESCIYTHSPKCVDGECSDCDEHSDCNKFDSPRNFCVGGRCTKCSAHFHCKDPKKSQCLMSQGFCAPCYSSSHCDLGVLNCITSTGTCEKCYEGFGGDNCEDILYYRCYGIPSWESNVCNSHGTCINSNVCWCKSGWFGYSCGSCKCYGTRSSDYNVCSGHGECLSTNNCNCQEGYYGEKCEKFKCFGIESSNRTYVCGGIGDDNWITGICEAPDNCRCIRNSGENCDIVKCFDVLANDTTVCSGRGKCRNRGCKCDENYYGDKCDVCFCFGLSNKHPSVCGRHGECVSEDMCECETGYFGNQCTEFTCDGNKNGEKYPCSENGLCKDFNVCECYDGFDPKTFCQECSPDRTGVNCQIPRCGEGTCQEGRGVCDGDQCSCFSDDALGYYDGSRCEKCKQNYFGEECKFFCDYFTCKSRYYLLSGECNLESKMNESICVCAGNFDLKSNCLKCKENYFGVKCGLYFNVSATSFQYYYNTPLTYIRITQFSSENYGLNKRIDQIIHPDDLKLFGETFSVNLGKNGISFYLQSDNLAKNSFRINFDLFFERVDINIGKPELKKYYNITCGNEPSDFPSPEFSVSYPKPLGVCDDLEINIKTKNTGGRKVEFRLNSVSGGDHKRLQKYFHDQFLFNPERRYFRISEAFLFPGEIHTFNATAETIFGSKSNYSFQVKKESIPFPKIEIRGGNHRVIKLTDSVRIVANLDCNSCDGETVELINEWKQISGKGVKLTTQNEGKVLFFPDYTFIRYDGKLVFEFSTKLASNAEISSSSQVTIEIESPPSRAEIRGGSYRDVSNSQDIEIDASPSRFPYSSQSTSGADVASFDNLGVTHSLFEYDMGIQELRSFVSTDSLISTGGSFSDSSSLSFDFENAIIPSSEIANLIGDANEDGKKKKLIIPKSTLGVGLYEIGVTVGSDFGSSDRSSLLLNVVGFTPPSIVIENLGGYPSRLIAEKWILNENDNSYLTLIASIDGEKDVSMEMDIKWKLINGDILAFTNGIMADTTKLKLSYPKHDSEYDKEKLMDELEFMLDVTKMGKSANSSVKVKINRSPKDGYCEIFPKEGFGFLTEFRINCVNWKDTVDKAQLYYTFSYLNYLTGKKEIVKGKSKDSFSSIFIPLSVSKKTSITVFSKIYDNQLCYASVVGEISLIPPFNFTVEDIEKKFNKLIEDSELELELEECVQKINLANELIVKYSSLLGEKKKEMNEKVISVQKICFKNDVYTEMSESIVFFGTKTCGNVLRMINEENKRREVSFFDNKKIGDAFEMLRNFSECSTDLFSYENAENFLDSIVMYLKLTRKVKEYEELLNKLLEVFVTNEKISQIELSNDNVTEMLGKSINLFMRSAKGKVIYNEDVVIELPDFNGTTTEEVLSIVTLFYDDDLVKMFVNETSDLIISKVVDFIVMDLAAKRIEFLKKNPVVLKFLIDITPKKIAEMKLEYQIKDDYEPGSYFPQCKAFGENGKWDNKICSSEYAIDFESDFPRLNVTCVCKDYKKVGVFLGFSPEIKTDTDDTKINTDTDEKDDTEEIKVSSGKKVNILNSLIIIAYLLWL